MNASFVTSVMLTNKARCSTKASSSSFDELALVQLHDKVIIGTLHALISCFVLIAFIKRYSTFREVVNRVSANDEENTFIQTAQMDDACCVVAFRMHCYSYNRTYTSREKTCTQLA